MYRELWLLGTQMKLDGDSSAYSQEADTSTHSGYMCAEHVQSYK